jgi:peroxiredoxin Q/BCP
MSELAIGDHAPAFSLPINGGGTLSLASLAGKKVVLYFYPKDDTSGCTAEAVAFSALAGDFSDAGAVVVGISPDTVKKHDKFAAKHGLSVVLASDEDTTVAQAYGVWKEKSMYGKSFMGIVRTTFLIDTDGRIAAIWPKVKVPGHAEAVLQSVRAL